MPKDAVGADDNYVPTAEELIVQRLLCDVFKLLDTLGVSDGILEERPRDAVHRSLIAVFDFIIWAGRHRRDLGLAPPNSHLPGDAVARLVMAFQDLNRGIVDPVFAKAAEPGTRRGPHALPLHVQLKRVRPAVFMELDRGRDDGGGGMC